MSAIVQRIHNHAREMIIIRDPRTGEDVGALPEAVPLHIRKAVNASRAAQQAWAATLPATRGSGLRAAARALAEAAPELARMNNRETGRPVDEALAGIAAGVSTLEQYAELGPVHRGHSLRGNPLASDYTVAEPRGVAVVLTPWNDPVAVACGLIGAALVTGNTVVHKPSERCPHLGAMLGEVLAAAFPPDVLISLTGGSGIGALLTEQTGVDVVAHVGSSAAGARIARASNLTGAHVIRENGGNDPLVVDDDVDPVWAAEQAAVGAFSNSGQICTAVERIYVHRAIAGPFCAALESQARRRNLDGQPGTRWWTSACAIRSTARLRRPWNPGRGPSRADRCRPAPGRFTRPPSCSIARRTWTSWRRRRSAPWRRFRWWRASMKGSGSRRAAATAWPQPC